MNMRINEILEEFISVSKKKFKENLVSIILFGSYARGTATKYSDIDLLVVVKKLTENFRKREKMKQEIGEIFFEKFDVIVQSLFMTKEEIKDNLNSYSPLFVTFPLGFKVIYDNNFFMPTFRDFLSRLKEDSFVYYEGRKKWEIKNSIKSLQ